mmetsp:Transcript_22873/g.59695  ORF Transcript_22873/g.59695 Transcript_22873/m.59695 type:complete len:222 (+) Transcript_22873:379-1044(+)
MHGDHRHQIVEAQAHAVFQVQQSFPHSVELFFLARRQIFSSPPQLKLPPTQATLSTLQPFRLEAFLRWPPRVGAGSACPELVCCGSCRSQRLCKRMRRARQFLASCVLSPVEELQSNRPRVVVNVKHVKGTVRRDQNLLLLGILGEHLDAARVAAVCGNVHAQKVLCIPCKRPSCCRIEGSRYEHRRPNHLAHEEGLDLNRRHFRSAIRCARRVDEVPFAG